MPGQNVPMSPKDDSSVPDQQAREIQELQLMVARARQNGKSMPSSSESEQGGIKLPKARITPAFLVTCPAANCGPIGAWENIKGAEEALNQHLVAHKVHSERVQRVLQMHRKGRTAETDYPNLSAQVAAKLGAPVRTRDGEVIGPNGPVEVSAGITGLGLDVPVTLGGLGGAIIGTATVVGDEVRMEISDSAVAEQVSSDASSHYSIGCDPGSEEGAHG